jgi:hypothetical protein
MRKQGRIFTTEDTENTEGKEKGKGRKQCAPSGWPLPSRATAFTLLIGYRGNKAAQGDSAGLPKHYGILRRSRPGSKSKN